MNKNTMHLLPEQLIQCLKERAAIKKFHQEDGDISEETEQVIATTKKILQLTPTSYGLQPYTFIFVSDPNVLTELKKESYNQPQITESNFIVVFCVKTNIDENTVDEYMTQIATVRGIEKSSLTDFSDMINGTMKQFSKDEIITWAEKQAYIAMGNALTSFAILGIDGCPMEGFNSTRYDDILQLKEKKLKSVLVLSVGKRSDDDPSHTQKKVRFPIERLCIDI